MIAVTLVAAMVMTMLLAVPASATHVSPTTVAGNATCKALLNDPDALEIKVGAGDLVAGGVYGPITVTSVTGSTMSFTSTELVMAVFMKGGNIGGNLYDYRPDGTLGDTGLVTPTNPSGSPAGISHISFCYVDDGVNNISATLSGTKFETSGGTLGDALEGWTIYIFDYDTVAGAVVGDPYEEVTDLNGEWTFTTIDFPENETLTFAVCEEQRAGWTQQSPVSGDAGTVDVTDYGTCYLVTVSDTAETVPGLDFQNEAFVDLTLSGSKFVSSTTDGLEGWTINIYNYDGTTVGALEATTTTATDGSWSWTSDDVAAGTVQQFVVCEEQQADWEQTGPAAGTGVIEVDGDNCYVVTSAGTADEAISGLNFENSALGSLEGTKFFDEGAGTGPLLANWPVVVTDANDVEVCSTTTDSTGHWSCSDLPAGTYTVTEGLPSGLTGTWTQTVPAAPGTYSPQLPANEPTTVSDLDFGNNCTVPTFPGGRTIGFWGNKNGQALIGTDDIAGLVALNLKNNSGTAFNPANKGAYKTWLGSANSNGTGVYMLSAQLSATYLNTHNAHGGANPITDPNYMVEWTVGGVTSTKSIADWIAAADAYLAAGSFGDKSITTSYKNLFDAINNNTPLGSAPGTPATCGATVATPQA